MISRVVAVLTPSSLLSAFTNVAVPAMGIVSVALSYARMPLIDWMGGVRVPPSVQPVANAYMFVIFYGFFAIIIGGLVWLGFLFVASPESTLEGFRVRQPGSVGKALPFLASIVILGFTGALPVTQREQKLRYEVERDLKNNQIKDALDILASHRQNEFPPQWSPPPWPECGEGDKNPSLTEIVKTLETRSDVPERVHSAYKEKLNRYRPSYKP